MKEYNIVITETLEKVIKINDENEIDALKKNKRNVLKRKSYIRCRWLCRCANRYIKRWIKC